MSRPGGKATSPAAGAPRAPVAAWWGEGAALVAVFALATLYASRVIWNIDIFWHIAAGRAFVAAGALPDTDIFSAIDPHRTWVSFQWGYEVLVYGLDQLGGLQLVRFAHAAVTLGAFAAFYLGLRRRLRWGPVASIVLLSLLMVLFEDRVRARPHVFNLLFWALLLPTLARGPAALTRRAAGWVAAATLLWANLHAGGALLFLVAALTLPVGATLGWAIEVPDRRAAEAATARRAWGWYLAALLPALLSPHFLRGNLQAFTMLDATESAIGEWYPAWHFLAIASTAGHVVCGLVPSLVALVWVARLVRLVGGLAQGWRGLRARAAQGELWRLGLSLALLVLAHRSVRFVWAAAFALVIMAPWLAAWWRAVWGARRERGRAWARALGITLALALQVVTYRFHVTAQHGTLAAAAREAFGSQPLDVRRFPVAQADLLAATGFEGGIFAQGNWGGYLLYRLFPRARVTADGRGNYPAEVTTALRLVYDPRVMADARNGPLVLGIYEGFPGVDAVVHQHPVWPGDFRPPPQRWTLVLSDRRGAVWIRHTPRGLRYLRSLGRRRASAQGPAAEASP